MKIKKSVASTLLPPSSERGKECGCMPQLQYLTNSHFRCKMSMETHTINQKEMF